jgi:Domain of unknown function (DUF4865)
MIAMQYRIALPADYDMGVIRDRVARTGSRLDDYPGLGLKAYLLRERGVHGSTVNEYAPFYLWTQPSGAAAFLWGGDGFQNIERDFGRPRVQTWIGDTVRTAADLGGITHAEIAVRPVTRDSVVTDVLAESVSSIGPAALVATAVDPTSWQVLVFALHVGAPIDPVGEVFEVLHLSTPEVLDLPRTVPTHF